MATVTKIIFRKDVKLMADTKKRNADNTDITPFAVPAELSKDNNLDEYIQPSSLDLLKARYGAIEEDEDIRNDGFELAKKSGLIRKQRPESQIYGYFSGPVNPKDEIRTDVDSPLAQVFDVTRSEFDSDTVSFSDISFEQEKKDAEIKAEEAPVEVEKPKRKRTTKAVEEAAEVEEKTKRKRTTKAAEETAELEEKPKRKRTTKTTEEVAEVEEKPKRKRSTKTTEEVAEVEEKPKRTRTTKAVAQAEVTEEKPKRTTKKLTEVVGEIDSDISVEESAPPPPVINNRYGFDTHTRVIYIDESADDGIQRNSEEELSSLFDPVNSNRKRRRLPWLRRKK